MDTLARQRVKIATMNEAGRITVPAEIRRALGISGAIIVRPAVVLRREDAWAYTPEHRALLDQAHDDSSEGRVKKLSESELKKLGS